MIIAPLVTKSIAKLVADKNSVAILGRMAKKSTGPEPWQVEDAARLRKLFDERAGEISQARFGADYEIGSQGMVWQYLSALRPLNIDAAVKFARGLGISIDDFSERIAEQIRGAYAVTSAGRRSASALPQAFSRLTQTQQRAVITMIESYGVTIEPDSRIGVYQDAEAGKKQSSRSS